MIIIIFKFCSNVLSHLSNSSPPLLRRTTWHIESSDVNSDSDSEMMSNAKSMVAAEFEVSSGNFEGKQLLSAAAKRVWEELYVCKKPVSRDFCEIIYLFNYYLFRHSITNLLLSCRASRFLDFSFSTSYMFILFNAN